MKKMYLKKGFAGLLTLALLVGLIPADVKASESSNASGDNPVTATEEVFVSVSDNEMVFEDEEAGVKMEAPTFQVGITKPDICFEGEHYYLKARPIGVGNPNPDDYTYEWFFCSDNWHGGWNKPTYLDDNIGYSGTHTDTLCISSNVVKGFNGEQVAWFGCRVTSKYPLVETSTEKREQHSSTEHVFPPKQVPKQPYTGILLFTDLDKPVAGATPDYTGASWNTSLFEFEKIDWYKLGANGNDETLMQPTDRFEVGAYKCRLYYHMAPGLYPTSGVAILQNGEYEAIVFYEDEIRIQPVKRYIEAYYNVKDELTEVELNNFTPPIEGQVPDTSLVAPAGLIVDNVIWSPKDEKAIADKEYTITVVLKSEKGYAIADTATVTLNGNPMRVVEYPNNVWFCECTLPVIPVENNPAVLSDSNLFMEVREVQSYAEKGIVLRCKPIYGEVKQGDTVHLTYYEQKQAKTRTVKVEEVEVKNGLYYLLIGTPFGVADDGSIIRGSLAVGAVVQGTSGYVKASSLALQGSLSSLTKDEGGIGVDAPEGIGVQCIINGKIYNLKLLALNGQEMIRPGETIEKVILGGLDSPCITYYGQRIKLSRKGKTFGYFTVTGENSNILNSITKVSVNVAAPEAGKVPATGATITDENAGYKVTDVSWNPKDSTFGYDTAYKVTIKAVANDKKVFDKNVSLSVNGQKATLTSGEGTDTILFTYTFPKLEKTLVAPAEDAMLSKVAFAEKGVKLTWKVADSVEGYRVYRKRKGESYAPLIDLAVTAQDRTAGTMTYMDESVKNNNDYIYTIRYFDFDTKTCYGTFDKTGKEIHYLQAPSNVSFTSKEEGLLIRWDAVEGAAKYKVYVRESEKWSPIATTSEAEYLYTGAEKGKANLYTVKCVAEDEKTGTSAFCEAGYEGIYNPDMQMEPLKMPVMSPLSSTVNGVKVSWGKVPGATMYRVYRKVDGGKWTKVKDTASTSITDTKAVSGTKYTYTVRCISEDGLTFRSSFDKVGLSIHYIAAPVISKVSKTTTGIKVTWGAVPGATAYRVYRKVPGGSWTKVKDCITTSFNDTNVVAGQEYIYTVRCVDLVTRQATSAYNTAGTHIVK